MFEVEFYQNRQGEEPVKDFLISLQKKGKTDKRSRTLANKVLTYIRILQEYGTRAGIPYMKHIEGDIWELRPQYERVLFFAWTHGHFVLLHHFHKKTQKTPAKELDCAKRRMRDYLERREYDGKQL